MTNFLALGQRTFHSLGELLLPPFESPLFPLLLLRLEPLLTAPHCAAPRDDVTLQVEPHLAPHRIVRVPAGHVLQRRLTLVQVDVPKQVLLLGLGFCDQSVLTVVIATTK